MVIGWYVFGGWKREKRENRERNKERRAEKKGGRAKEHTERGEI